MYTLFRLEEEEIMNIALLGGSGVGKTNYLCTLFREIRKLNSKYGIHINYLDPDGSVENFRISHDYLDTSYSGHKAPEFCKATTTSTMLNFDICFKSGEENKKMHILSYDYEGEYTNNILQEKNVKDVLSYCDILFCFLDSTILERAYNSKTRYDIVMSNLPTYVMKLNQINIRRKMDKKLHVSLILTKIDAVTISETELIDYVCREWNNELRNQNCDAVNFCGVYASTIAGSEAIEFRDAKFKIKENAILKPRNILAPLFDSCNNYVYYCKENQFEFETIPHKVLTALKAAARIVPQILRELKIPIPQKEFLSSCMTTHLGYKIAKKCQFYIDFFESLEVSTIIRRGF